ncbi:hypothetical protein LC593_33195 [Nostoc sp. CHAB 5844]|nr:hypothetical protein [Nostoc sp. CHAB 5844]
MSHCGEAAPILAVPVVSAALASLRASGGLLNPKGGRVSRHKGDSAVGGFPDSRATVVKWR